MVRAVEKERLLNCRIRAHTATGFVYSGWVTSVADDGAWIIDTKSGASVLLIFANLADLQVLDGPEKKTKQVLLRNA